MAPQQYTLSFDANGGEGYMAPQSFTAGVEQAIAANAFTREGYYFSAWNTRSDGSGTSYANQENISLSTNTTLYAQWGVTITADVTGNMDGHDYIDLGLPSGTKWANYNLGAENTEDAGDYYAWGEIETKSAYTWENYVYGNVSALTKYCQHQEYGLEGYVDNKSQLDAEDDAAYINWGGKWRMPTLEEQKELVENCTWTWTSQKGVMGYLVTSNINGNSIFLPASGYCDDVYLDEVDVKGHYWTSTLRSSGGYSDCAYYLLLSSEKQDWNSYDRHYGRTIRAVCE